MLSASATASLPNASADDLLRRPWASDFIRVEGEGAKLSMIGSVWKRLLHKLNEAAGCVENARTALVYYSGPAQLQAAVAGLDGLGMQMEELSALHSSVLPKLLFYESSRAAVRTHQQTLTHGLNQAVRYVVPSEGQCEPTIIPLSNPQAQQPATTSPRTNSLQTGPATPMEIAPASASPAATPSLQSSAEAWPPVADDLTCDDTLSLPNSSPVTKPTPTQPNLPLPSKELPEAVYALEAGVKWENAAEREEKEKEVSHLRQQPIMPMGLTATQLIGMGLQPHALNLPEPAPATSPQPQPSPAAPLPPQTPTSPQEASPLEVGLHGLSRRQAVGAPIRVYYEESDELVGYDGSVESVDAKRGLRVRLDGFSKREWCTTALSQQHRTF